MKQRLEYIDLLRGLSIFFVVYGHTIARYAPDGADQIGIAISTFWMSMLFFISGYINAVVHKVEVLKPKKYILKKIETVILPFLSWSLIVPVFLGNTSFSSITEALQVLWFFPIEGYWFLPVLFCFFLIYAFKGKFLSLVNYSKKWNAIFCGVTVCLLMLIGGGGIGQYFLIVYGIYLASFYFGELLWQSARLKFLVMKNWVFGISALVLCLLWQFYPLTTNGNMFYSFLNLLMTAICSLSACLFFYNFFIKVQLPRCLHIALSQIGQNSIMIYLIAILLIPQSVTLPDNWTFATVNIVMLGIAIANTALRFVIGKFIYQIPGLRWILFGKR